MRILATAITVALVGLLGCSGEGLDLTGNDIEGFDTVGAHGGVLYSADERLQIDIEAGALASKLDVIIGQVDDCLPGAITCYEVVPHGTVLRIPATATLTLVDPDQDPPESLATPLVFVRTRDTWRPVPKVRFDGVALTLELRSFSAIGVVPQSN